MSNHASKMDRLDVIVYDLSGSVGIVKERISNIDRRLDSGEFVRAWATSIRPGS
jgi:hypothetical protein